MGLSAARGPALWKEAGARTAPLFEQPSSPLPDLDLHSMKPVSENPCGWVPVASYYTVVHVLAPHPTQPPIPLHTDRDDPVVDLGRVCVVAARRGFIHSKMEIKSA